MGRSLADIREKCRLDRAALRRLGSRVRGCGRAIGLSFACVLVMLASGKLNFALAVDMGGDVIGYVSSREELDTIVETVRESVSGALGYDWNAPELTTHMTLGESTTFAVENAAVVADRLLETAETVAPLYLVYVDGSAVCAFETGAEAAEALQALRARYVEAEAAEAAFAETVIVAPQVADRSLLENNQEALEAAVTVVTVLRVTVETVLPYKTVTEADDALFADERRVIRAGVEGLEVTETQVTRHDGETAEAIVLSRSRCPAVTEIVAQGTRTRVSTGDYIWPLEEAEISSAFGYRVSVGSAYHQGVDLAADEGSAIFAADGGTVVFAGTYKSYGQLVQIEHDNGDVTYYAHCSRILVSEGDVVEQGEKIALVGTTGVSTGNHLHFEVHPGGGDAVDPMDCLPPKNRTLRKSSEGCAAFRPGLRNDVDEQGQHDESDGDPLRVLGELRIEGLRLVLGKERVGHAADCAAQTRAFAGLEQNDQHHGEGGEELQDGQNNNKSIHDVDILSWATPHGLRHAACLLNFGYRLRDLRTELRGVA